MTTNSANITNNKTVESLKVGISKIKEIIGFDIHFCFLTFRKKGPRSKSIIYKHE